MADMKKAPRGAFFQSGGLQVVATLVVQGEVQTHGFLFLVDSQTHDHVQHLEDHEGDDAGVDDGEGHALELDEQLGADVL